VRAVFAVAPGVRAQIWAMAAPSFTREVVAARKARSVKASVPHASAVHSES
jgi:hypothetical protein